MTINKKNNKRKTNLELLKRIIKNFELKGAPQFCGDKNSIKEMKLYIDFFKDRYSV